MAQNPDLATVGDIEADRERARHELTACAGKVDLLLAWRKSHVPVGASLAEGLASRR